MIDRLFIQYSNEIHAIFPQLDDISKLSLPPAEGKVSNLQDLVLYSFTKHAQASISICVRRLAVITQHFVTIIVCLFMLFFFYFYVYFFS